jgi:hypothetical protein
LEREDVRELAHVEPGLGDPTTLCSGSKNVIFFWDVVRGAYSGCVCEETVGGCERPCDETRMAKTY